MILMTSIKVYHKTLPTNKIMIGVSICNWGCTSLLILQFFQHSSKRRWPHRRVYVYLSTWMKIYRKYLDILNCVFTMNSSTEKKLHLMVSFLGKRIHCQNCSHFVFTPSISSFINAQNLLISVGSSFIFESLICHLRRIICEESFSYLIVFSHSYLSARYSKFPPMLVCWMYARNSSEKLVMEGHRTSH